jgi:hypothetical protein
VGVVTEFQVLSLLIGFGSLIVSIVVCVTNLVLSILNLLDKKK